MLTLFSMEIFVFFALCVQILSIDGVFQDNSLVPITIIYYPPGKKYVISDALQVGQINKFILKTNHVSPLFGIISACGAWKHEDEEYALALFMSSYETIPQLPNPETCELPSIPTLINFRNNRSLYNIGYTVREDDTTLRLWNLPSFRSADSDLLRIPVIILDFDENILRTHQTQHTFFLYKYQKPATIPCLNFDTKIREPYHLKVTKNLDFSKFYVSVHQYDIFQEVQKPNPNQTSSSNWGNWQTKMLQVLVDDRVFVQHQLVPIDDFNDEPSRQSTCFLINTAPVWQPISFGLLRKIENFIRYVAHVLPMNTITVRTMVHDTLQLKNKSDGSLQRVYLDHVNYKLPVPRVIFKVITYAPPFFIFDEYRKKFQRHIVIATHNEFSFDETKLCVNDICEMAGWYITHDRMARKAFYCCSIDDQKFTGVYKQFGLNASSFDVLNLKNIPTRIDADGNLTETKDITEDIRKLSGLSVPIY